MSIVLENIYKDFQPGLKSQTVSVLRDLSLHIKVGEIVSLFGPNGCGKTTLLNLIAGLEDVTQGQITINDKPVLAANIGYVFQNYQDSCFPWKTVFQNVAFGLVVKNVAEEKRAKIVTKLLKTTGLWPHRNKYIYELSGGLRQLTAICQTMAYNPEILLLDEPFNSLDYLLCKKMEIEFLKLLEEHPKTTLIVSHDIDEAIFLADRVIVLSQRPACIKNVIPVKLPKPRTLSMITSNEFTSIKKKVLKSFSYD